jgi:hypothetical protein
VKYSILPSRDPRTDLIGRENILTVKRSFAFQHFDLSGGVSLGFAMHAHQSFCPYRPALEASSLMSAALGSKG